MSNSNRFMLSQYLSTLNNELCLTSETHAKREHALEILPELLDSIPLDNVSLDQLLSAYFICSYAHTPRKHEIKKVINKLLRENLLHHGIPEADLNLRYHAETHKPNKKPVCLIVTNWFTSTHVMYRCFAKSLTAIKEHFHCVNLCLHQTDYIAAQCFDKVMQIQIGAIPYPDAIKQLIALIRAENPDVILYADIAMHPYGVMLSNLRLAPLQCAMLGHPAPNHSKQIDYFIMEDSYKGFTPDYTTEPVYFYPAREFAINPPLAKPMSNDHKRKRTKKRTKPRIIVPCSIHKVTYPFLLTVKTIQEETGAEIHITSNVAKGNEKIKEQIQAIIPVVHYYPGMVMDEYIALIADMDMFLTTYPFAGYSTVMDCLSQAVPGIAMLGTDVAGRQASSMMEQCGITSNETLGGTFNIQQRYIDGAIILARDHSFRKDISDILLDRFASDSWRNLPIFAETAPGIARSLAALTADRKPG